MSVTGSSQNLDTRLLRFRTKRGEENPTSLVEDLLAAGRNGEAQEVATSAVRAKPEDAALLLLEGRSRFAAGDLLGAQAALLKAARIDPSRKDTFRWLGEVLLKRGDPDRASKVLERARAIDPNDRTVLALQERALRLASVASSADSPPSSVPPPPMPPPKPPAEERTVIRSDVSEQLRKMTAEELTSDEPGAAAPEEFAEESTEEAPLEAMQEVDEGPTGTYSGADLEEHIARSRKTATGVAPKGAISRTLTFGSPGAPAVKPPGKPNGPAPWLAPKAAPAAPAKAPPFAPVAKTDAPKQVAIPAAPPPRMPDAPPPRMPDAPPPRMPEPQPGAPSPFERPSDEFMPLTPMEGDAPPQAADVQVGGAEREDVDEVLRVLRAAGLFEPPQTTGQAGQWASRGEAAAVRGGLNIGLWLGGIWVFVLLLAGGGWFAWTKWVDAKHAEAAQLVAQARREAEGGDHADLVDAERHLREARDKNPNDSEGPTLLLFVHTQRALEDGAFEAGYLRPTIARGETVHADAAYIAAAQAVLAAAEGGYEQAAQRIQAALSARPHDARILYVAGRLEQRLGSEDALAHLQSAVDADHGLVAAAIALAEARYDEGQADEAVHLLDGVLARDREHLRARLWRAFMTSDDEDAAHALTALDAMRHGLEEHGAPTDQVLYHLTRSRLVRRQGHLDQAGAEVDLALRGGASEPRLLALVATEGARAGRMPAAEQAARAAVEGVPSNTDFRKQLAEIQIARHNGRAAMATLVNLSDDDPDVLTMRAEAAMLQGTDEALTAAAGDLDAYVTANPDDASVPVKALRIRLHVALGEAQQMIEQARTLSHDAPGDPVAAVALGECALRLFDARTAQDALQAAVTAAPDDAEAHFLLGRARRMAGDGEGAEASLRRALEILPEHTDARLVLGSLLLDLGKYREADEIYGELARRTGTAGGQAINVAGKLGHVEALIGLGRLEDARVQLEGLRPESRETPTARLTAAHLALARERPAEAIAQIRPIATDAQAGATVVSLYADALLAANQTEAAAEQYARALSIDNGMPEAFLGQAELAVRAGHGDDALQALAHFAHALTVRIRPPGMRARALMLQGRVQLDAHDDAAGATLRQATELEGAPADAFFWLGEALSNNNAADARTAYEHYLQMAPHGQYQRRAEAAIRHH